MIQSFWNRLRLNLRALNLAVAGHWLRLEDVAESYDAIAETYDRNWLVHLQSTTDRLHELLAPSFPNANRILEPGCGSGYSTARLREQYPDAAITAVDISSVMLEKAKQRLANHGAGIEFRCDDMLDCLKRQPSNAFDLIFSGWAIGYSNPAAIVVESARTLASGGGLAVIVNRLNTIPAVFDLFRKAMRRFPDSLQKAVWPRFPKDQTEISRLLAKHRFTVDRIEEGAAAIRYPSENRLDWLLGTGVLAGFDTVLPLRKTGPVRDWFADELDKIETGWEHRYILFIALKRGMSCDSVKR